MSDTRTPLAYTVAEIAELLPGNISRDRVRRLIRTGRLRARLIGKTYVVPAQALQDYLDGDLNDDGGPLHYRDSA